MYAYAHTHTLVVNAVVPTVLMSSKGDVCVYICIHVCIYVYIHTHTSSS